MIPFLNLLLNLIKLKNLMLLGKSSKDRILMMLGSKLKNKSINLIKLIIKIE